MRLPPILVFTGITDNNRTHLNLIHMKVLAFEIRGLAFINVSMVAQK